MIYKSQKYKKEELDINKGKLKKHPITEIKINIDFLNKDEKNSNSIIDIEI